MRRRCVSSRPARHGQAGRAGHKLGTIRFLVEREIPVCAHLGLTPQSVNRFGGFKVQGRDEAAAKNCARTRAVQDAGASLLVLECVPSALAAAITADLAIPTIGIGAGPAATARCWCCTTCSIRLDGGHRRPKFVKDFLAEGGSVAGAVRAYVDAVRDGFVPRRSAFLRMIETITELSRLRDRVGEWKRAGLRVGFVPTMGNLHAGHYSLVEIAKRHADRVVASVFVNPTQFGPNEDFSRYPRTPQQDAAGLEAAGCDALWLPDRWRRCIRSAPRARCACMCRTWATRWKARIAPGISTASRPVVARLFNQAQADVAVFGRKDYQQLR